MGSTYWGGIVDAGLYRPLTLLSFGINRALGESAFGFHLVNDLLHAVTSALVVLTARALGASRFVALAAGLLFALHPLQTEAVNTLVGRAEILGLGLSLGAFVLFARGGSSIAVGVSFFLALCSKESAAFAVALFGLYWLLFERRAPIPIAVAVAAYGALRIAVLGSLGIGGREIGFLDNPVASASLGARIVNAFVLVWEYAWRIVWPVTLSADYSYSQIPTTPDVRIVLGAAIIAALGVLAWRKRGIVAFAALAFVATLAGFLHVLFPLGTLFAERLTYLPMFGAALLIALGLAVLPRRGWLLGLILAVFAWRVVTRNPDWHDNESLFRETVQTSPRSARSHFLLGAELLDQERYREAAAAFEHGLAIYPSHLGAKMSLGEAFLADGEQEDALAAFEEALAQSRSGEIRARAVEAALASGRRSAREEDWSSARDFFSRALELDPESAEAANSLGLVVEREGGRDEARRLYERALAIDDDYVPALLNLASVRMSADELDDLEGAEELFRKAISLAPDSYEAYNGLGIALGRQGRTAEAEAAFRRAVEIDPSLPAARDNLRALGKTP